MSTPRPEYPRPQFTRPDWLCLNGEWQFEIDGGDSGLERGLHQRELEGAITVPFCPESELSGVHDPDFMAAVWYRREVAIPARWAGRRVLLHFQAVDYDTTVWIDGVEVARHRGGARAARGWPAGDRLHLVPANHHDRLGVPHQRAAGGRSPAASGPVGLAFRSARRAGARSDAAGGALSRIYSRCGYRRRNLISYTGVS